MTFKFAFYTWLARLLDPRGAREADAIIARIKEIQTKQNRQKFPPAGSN
jgi:hypothetical protein